MKVTLLSIKTGDATNSYDVTFQLGSEERVFRFNIAPLNFQIDGKDIFVTSSEEFDHLFRCYYEAYATADQIVGRFHEDRWLDLPIEIGDYDLKL